MMVSKDGELFYKSSKIGMVYTTGRDVYKTGILGIGKGVHEQPNPSPLVSLIDYRIKHVQLSNDRAWAIDSNGRLFIWGRFLNENLMTDSIVIPQPLLVQILKEYEIGKANVFSSHFEETFEEFGTNI